MVATLALLAPLGSPLVRDLRPGVGRCYRVEVDQEGGDHYAYRFEAKVVSPKVPKGVKAEAHLQFKMTDYRAVMGGQKTSARTIGGGEVSFDPAGLPAGLNIAGPQGPVWLPLLSLYLPAEEESAFVVPKVPIGPGLDMSGKGALVPKGGGREMDLDALVSRGEARIGTLKIVTVLDAQGWPKRADGTLVSQEGTYRFTLR